MCEAGQENHCYTDLLLTTDEAQVARSRGRFDLILDSIPAPHDFSPLLRLLGLDGTLSVVGFPLPRSRSWT